MVIIVDEIKTCYATYIQILCFVTLREVTLICCHSPVDMEYLANKLKMVQSNKKTSTTNTLILCHKEEIIPKIK